MEELDTVLENIGWRGELPEEHEETKKREWQLAKERGKSLGVWTDGSKS